MPEWFVKIGLNRSIATAPREHTHGSKIGNMFYGYVQQVAYLYKNSYETSTLFFKIDDRFYFKIGLNVS